MKEFLQKFDKTFYITIFIVLVFVLMIFVSQSNLISSFKSYSNSSKLEIGSEAPFFVLNTPDKKEVDFKEEFSKNEITILFFLESYCGACQKQTPELVDLYKEYESKGIKVFAIDIIEEDKETIKEFTEKYKVNFPILLDKKGKVSAMYKVKRTPTVFFVNKDGIIKNRFEEKSSLEKIKEIVNNILEENEKR